MSSDTLSSTKTVTSRLGRNWLQAAESQCRNDSEIATGGSPAHIVVTVPNLSNSTAPEMFAPESLMPEEVAKAFKTATDVRLDALRSNSVQYDVESYSVEPPRHIEPDKINSQSALVKVETVPIKAHRQPDVAIVELPQDMAPVLDLSEKPADWIDKSDGKDTSRVDPIKTTSSEANPAIDTLVDAILNRFPLGDPVVLMFVGSESNPHIDETCARVGSALADRDIGRILLLDSDLANHALSEASGVSGQPGISDVVNRGDSWESAIYGRSVTGLDFLAAGTGDFSHHDKSARLREAASEMKREYQFICVAAGNAHSSSAKLWYDICDGSYLLVSVKNSNETYAKSAVAELQTSGARILGCVVTDVE